VIDSEGYRPNVGIILCNAEGRLFWGRRIGQRSWQFPQGGIQRDESPEQAMFRELTEEVGLRPEHVRVIGCTKGWLRYRLPKRLVRQGGGRQCIGQKQIWFLLLMLGGEDEVRLDLSERPEFDHWQWVDYWYPLRAVVPFKRYVYWRALHELAPLLFPEFEAQARPAVSGQTETPLAGSRECADRFRREAARIRARCPGTAGVARRLEPDRPAAIPHASVTIKQTILLPLRRVETSHHPVITRMVVSARRASVQESGSATPALEPSVAIASLEEVRAPRPGAHGVSRR
jgi:putative (di)nucleoside polyphosphate hydrolase